MCVYVATEPLYLESLAFLIFCLYLTDEALCSDICHLYVTAKALRLENLAFLDFYLYVSAENLWFRKVNVSRFLFIYGK